MRNIKCHICFAIIFAVAFLTTCFFGAFISGDWGNLNPMNYQTPLPRWLLILSTLFFSILYINLED